MGKLQYLIRRAANMDLSGLKSAVSVVSKRCGRPKFFVLCDMLGCAVKYRAGYTDYRLFEFDSLTPAQRATYVTRGKNNEYVRRLNPPQYWNLLSDKTQFLRRFDGLHGRLWLDLRQAGFEEFEAFCQRNPLFVVKPLDGTCGRGIELLDASQIADLHARYDECIQNGQLLVEQYVVQHEDYARIYPLSVNTLRLVTITRPGGQPAIVFSCFRLGNNGRRVDNLNSGGMAAIVDLEKGCISTPGADKDGLLYSEHPFTGVTLKGAPLAFTREAAQLVKEAALRIPELGYVGWDVAVTPNGPILIEANHFPGNDIYQFRVHLGPDRIGLAPRFDAAAGFHA